MKDRSNKNGNNRETFTYYEDLNEILGCRAKITPKTVVECSFEDDTVEKRSESSDAKSDGHGEDQFLSEAFLDENQLATRVRKLWPVRQIPPSKNLPNLFEHCLSRFFSRVNLEATPVRKLLVCQTSLPLNGPKMENPVARVSVKQNILPF